MSPVLVHQTIADLADMLASHAAEVAEKLLPNGKRAVSYTHLTLPTNREV